MDRPVEITRSYADCKMCMDIADMCNQIPDCSRCNRDTGEWIDTVSSMFGTKAIVQTKDGSVKEFPISRIKVITKRMEK